MKEGCALFRVMFDPATLRGLGQTFAENYSYDYDTSEDPDHVGKWVYWHNTVIARNDIWALSTVEEFPPFENIAINCRIYANADGDGAPLTNNVRIMHWDGEDEHASQLVVNVTRQLLMRLTHKITRWMRKREEHGLDPWLRPEHFKHKRQRSEPLP